MIHGLTAQGHSSYGSRLGAVSCVATWLTFGPLIVLAAGPSTMVTGDGSMNTVTTVNGNTVEITGGARPSDGQNLFHSFGQFDVGQGNTANFINDSGLPTENILSRVTGGEQSKIFGTIKTTDFGDANLFLLNPSGVIFGPTASLDVGGSFHVTTADYLRFTDNNQFTAIPGPSDAVLSVESIAAFGFLGENPAGIAINQSFLHVPDGKSLSFVGGNLAFTGDGSIPSAFIIASHGQVNMASVASDGEVIWNNVGSGLDVNVDSFDQLGEIVFTGGALIDVSGDGGGTVIIRGGRLMVDKSFIFADNMGSQNSTQGGIDIQVAEDLTITDGIFSTDVYGEGHAGDITIHSGTLLLERTSAPLFFPSARIGSLSNPGKTENTTFGNSGNLHVTVDGTLTIKGRAEMTTSNGLGTNGKTGDIDVQAENVFVSGTPDDSNDFTGIFSNTFGSGKGGNLQIKAHNVELTTQASLQASTRGLGEAGEISLDLEDGKLTIQEGSFILVDTNSTGNAGTLSIVGKNVLIRGVHDAPDPEALGVFTGLDSSTAGSGVGGKIDINITGNLFIEQSGIVRANSTSTGNAGNIALKAGDIIRVQNGKVTSEAGNAFGGTIKFDAGNLIQVINSDVTSRVQEGSADAGSINFDPRFIVIQNSQVLSTAVSGDGGPISFFADSAILVDPFSTLDASSQFGGSGTIDIQAPIQNLSGTIAPLPQAPVNVAALYASRCAAQKGGQFSSFVQSGYDGLPRAPGGLLSSPHLSIESVISVHDVRTSMRSQPAYLTGLDDHPLEDRWAAYRRQSASDPFGLCAS